MLSPIPIPSLLITGTDTGIGKTIVAASIAQILNEQGHRVAVFKPAGSGCVHRREGLVSEDAELLAHCANARHPLDQSLTAMSWAALAVVRGSHSPAADNR